MLGADDGGELGAANGDPEGAALGSVVGCFDGDADGIAVGALVGNTGKHCFFSSS